MKRINHFDQYLSWLSCAPDNLPYQFGGATQCGRINAHNNNQDAIAISARDGLVIGIVCDGCSNSSRGYSNNEVGARLLAMLTSEIVLDVVKKSKVVDISDHLKTIEEVLFERLDQILSAIVGQEDRDTAIKSYFMTTILGFVVDSENYAIFGCGDGLYAVDNQVKLLHEQEGKYIAAKFLSGFDWRAELALGHLTLCIHQLGPVADMRSIMVGTDGFEDITENFKSLIGEFFIKPDENREKPGFCPWMGEEFRRRVWQKDVVYRWANNQDSHDDRSFILLRNISVLNKNVYPVS